MQLRALVEARTEGAQLIETTLHFLEKNASYLTAGEIESTKSAINELQNNLSSGAKDEIHTAIEKLNELSRPYAERIMDQAIGVALKGKVI
jgi:molecular chaperone HscA